ncbi:hypothetical protein TNCV_4014711 [Trichonephila clavipes]|uniref:Uncharacterized protein n=1 Tax=Trichonephila clavipes TaxID=2585209 RepID=A0A8X6RPK1_TRICX|nr:hypothetical protein TNCV_4014711 [Trichonephila clavipes]
MRGHEKVAKKVIGDENEKEGRCVPIKAHPQFLCTPQQRKGKRRMTERNASHNSNVREEGVQVAEERKERKAYTRQKAKGIREKTKVN